MEWRPIERGGKKICGKKILESLEGFLGGTLKGGEWLACGAAVSHRRVKLLGGVMRHWDSAGLWGMTKKVSFCANGGFLCICCD